MDEDKALYAGVGNRSTSATWPVGYVLPAVSPPAILHIHRRQVSHFADALILFGG